MNRVAPVYMYWSRWVICNKEMLYWALLQRQLKALKYFDVCVTHIGQLNGWYAVYSVVKNEVLTIALMGEDTCLVSNWRT